jgi:hypothetical protein
MGARVESMYVSEIKNHRLHNNECLGDLKFDCAASKKWGLLFEIGVYIKPTAAATLILQLFYPVSISSNNL